MYGSLTSGSCLLVEDNPGVIPLLLERLHERLDVWILDRPWTKDASLRFAEGGEPPPANLHFGSEAELAEALSLKV
jgi:hypothetical protein